MASKTEKQKNKNKKAAVAVSITDDPATLRKKITKYNEFYKDLQKEFTDNEQELQIVQNDLRSSRREMDESKIEADVAIKSKNDIEIQLKHLIEVKKEQEKDIRQLSNKQADLEVAIESFDSTQQKWGVQKNKDIQEFERQKNAIQIQSRFLGRKLEDDRRHLQSQFFESKQELKRNYRREVDQLKQRQELQLSDFERDSKHEITSLREKFNQKIKQLEVDNYNMRTKIESVNQTFSKQEDEITRLERSLQRETTNSEVMGTTSVEWLDQEQRETFMNEFLTSEEKTLDRLTQQIRDKLIAAGEDLLLAKRRRNAADKQVKELRHDLDEQNLLFRRLETSKNDIERRLTKRIEQLEDQILRKNRHTEADYTLLKHKLQGNVEDKDDQLVALKKELDELQAKIRSNKVTANKMSDKVSEKLDIERDRFIDLEKEKHDLASEALHYNRQIGDLKERISSLDKEVARYKGQVGVAESELEKLQDKNHTLEQSIRRLENTPIKA